MINMSDIIGIKKKNVCGKVGSQAISTIDFEEWIKEKDVEVKPKKKKKEIINTIFVDFIKNTNDDFWVEKFTNASIGKFPAKFSYSNGILKYKKGNKFFSKELINGDLETKIECLNFFNTHGIFSTNDIYKSKITEPDEKQNEVLTWENSSEKVKELLISYYINDMNIVMSLTKLQSKQLIQTIYIGVSFKILTKSDFIVDNNRIIKINNILWDNINNKFLIDKSIQISSSKCENSKSKNRKILKNNVENYNNSKWNKYIALLNTKIEKNNRLELNKLTNNKSYQKILTSNENVEETTPIDDTIYNIVNSNDSEIESDICDDIIDDDIDDD